MDSVAHADVIPQLVEHLDPLFRSSPDGVYVWLDEEHWSCNDKLASILGASAAELENTPNFLQRFVHEEDQGHFSWNYWNRVQALTFPTTFRFRGTRDDGTEIQLETDMIPLTYGGHIVAYHFVRLVG